MSADLLGRASARMKELAGGVEHGYLWSFSPGRDGMEGDPGSPALIAHIAAWTPAVALMVAELLESHAEWVAEHEDCGLSCEVYDPETDPGVELARRFLRAES